MRGLRKAIYDREDGGVMVGRGQTGDKVQCYLGPGAVWNGEWLQEALWGLVGDLGLRTD